MAKRSDDKPGSGRTSRSVKSLTIDETQIVRVTAPGGSRFLGYVDFVVQDVVLKTHVTQYRRERWLLADKFVLVAPLPAGIDGKHFGPELRRYVVYLHHHGRMPQARIVTLLRDMGVCISAGQVDAILQDEALRLSDERDAMVHAGVTHAPYVQADDTGARQKRMVSEAALYAAVRQRIDKKLIVLSDNAGQINLLQHEAFWDRQHSGTGKLSLFAANGLQPNAIFLNALRYSICRCM